MSGQILTNANWEKCLKESINEHFQSAYGNHPDHPGMRLVPAEYDEDTDELIEPEKWVPVVTEYKELFKNEI